MQPRLRSSLVTIGTTALLAAFLAGCSEATGPDPVLPTGSSLAKGGNGGGKPGGGDGGGDGGSGDNNKGGIVAAGDLALEDGDAPALESLCPTPNGFRGSGWAFVYGKSGCLLPPTLWTSTTYAEYAIADDVIIGVQVEKGKNGRITHVRLSGQDVDGPEGIFHDTDWIAVAQPVVPTTAGFTLHVHARNVPVWRWNSHLARGGNRVEVVGMISLGDLVYPPQ